MARAAFRCSLAVGTLLALACSAEKKEKPAELPASRAAQKTAAPPPQAPAAMTQRDQWYQVVLDAEGGPMPFTMKVPLPRRAQNTVVIANAEERIELQMHCKDDDCVVLFPVFGTELRLRFSSNKAFRGEWVRSPYIDTAPVPLSALAVDGPGSSYRFEGGHEPLVDVSGEWSLEIEGVGPGKAHFRQDDEGLVTGWMIPQNIGDLRYLDGRVNGNWLYLSTFDGQHAYYLEFEIGADGKTLEGTWHNQVEWHYPVTGKRGKGPSLESLHTLRVKDGGSTVSIPELAALKGKPVIVDLYGTWCPACIDLMPTLVDLYERYQPEGLEVLSIALEPGEDRAFAEQQVARFKERYGIVWPSSIRLGDDIRAGLPPELDNVQGFPVTIFVDRKGEVHAMHSGFVGPAAEGEHDKLVALFDKWARAIVDSKP